MTAAGKLFASKNFRFFEMYRALASVYWVVTAAAAVLLRWGEKNSAATNGSPLRSSPKRKSQQGAGMPAPYAGLMRTEPWTAMIRR
jgi:hypothetical protein